MQEVGKGPRVTLAHQNPQDIHIVPYKEQYILIASPAKNLG